MPNTRCPHFPPASVSSSTALPIAVKAPGQRKPTFIGSQTVLFDMWTMLSTRWPARATAVVTPESYTIERDFFGILGGPAVRAEGGLSHPEIILVFFAVALKIHRPNHAAPRAQSHGDRWTMKPGSRGSSSPGKVCTAATMAAAASRRTRAPAPTGGTAMTAIFPCAGNACNTHSSRPFVKRRLACTCFFISCVSACSARTLDPACAPALTDSRTARWQGKRWLSRVRWYT